MMKSRFFLLTLIVTTLLSLLALPKLVSQTNALPLTPKSAALSEVSANQSQLTFTVAATIYLPYIAKGCDLVPLTPSCLQMLIPLYIYPDLGSQNSAWDKVAAAASMVPITVIVNPNSGPGMACDPIYDAGIEYLRAQGVTVVGYVFTNYGTRSSDAVKDDINMYNSCYRPIDGIFFDEVANGGFDYYNDLSGYVRAISNTHFVVLNPGIAVDECYIQPSPGSTCYDTPPDPLGLPVGNLAVIFEDFGNKWPDYNPPDFLCDYSASHFAILAHSLSATDITTMQHYIDLAVTRNIGYIYLTSDVLSNPWDTLPTFWQDEVQYIKIVNKQPTC